MAAITPITGGVRPLDGSTVIGPLETGEAMDVGNAVELMSDGTIDEAGSSSTTFLGLVVAGSNKGSALAAGEMASVIAFGPCAGFSGLTPGQLIYLGANGALDDAGTKAVGYALTADSIFVLPMFRLSAS